MSRGPIRDLVDDSRPERWSSSSSPLWSPTPDKSTPGPSSLLSPDLPPTSVQINACCARLMMWPTHLSKLLISRSINKENYVMPDMMPVSVPLNAMLFTQILTHNIHFNFICRGIVLINLTC